MAYSNVLANRIRDRLDVLSNIEEKTMMGGLTFMYNGKMCIGIIGDEMMCRIDPALQEMALEKRGCRMMDFTGRPMKRYILISEEGMKSKTDFDFWVDLCLDFNKNAKASKKRK